MATPSGYWVIKTVDGKRTIENEYAPVVDKFFVQNSKPLSRWDLSQNEGPYYMLNLEVYKFERDFPLNCWSIRDNGLSMFDEKDLVKFKHEFPECTWKIEDIYDDNVKRMSIIYFKDLVRFKKEFPISVYRFEDQRIFENQLTVGTEYPYTLGAFGNVQRMDEIVIPLQMTHVSEEAFLESSIKKAYIPTTTVFENLANTFPPNCEIIRYSSEEELELLKSI